MTPDEIELTIEVNDICRPFIDTPADHVGHYFADRYRNSAPQDRSAIKDQVRHAAAVLSHMMSQMHLRTFDAGAWHRLDAISPYEMAEIGARLIAQWQEQEIDEDAEEALDAERNRIDDLERDGYYGRTHCYDTECENWIFIRFGQLPKDGRSIFGLAGEDNEDGPDEWRMIAGNRTHESGVCVLRARHHPTVAGAYTVDEPDFHLALYGVSDDYFNSIIPRFEDGEIPTCLRVDGAPLTVAARDGTRRLELGSDGEYLVDTSQPYTVEQLDLSQIWLSKWESALDFLARRRGYTPPAGDIAPAF